MMHLVQAHLLLELPSTIVHRGDVVVAKVIEVGRDRRGGPTLELRAIHVGPPAERPPTALGAEQPSEAAQRPTEPASTLKSEFHQLEHKPLELRYFLDGKLLPLSHQKYRLLDLLVRHPNHVLSVGQLLAGAWENSLETDEPAVQSCLHRLRQKLGPRAKQMIENRRKDGYCFRPEPLQA